MSFLENVGSIRPPSQSWRTSGFCGSTLFSALAAVLADAPFSIHPPLSESLDAESLDSLNFFFFFFFFAIRSSAEELSLELDADRFFFFFLLFFSFLTFFDFFDFFFFALDGSALDDILSIFCITDGSIQSFSNFSFFSRSSRSFAFSSAYGIACQR